MTIREAILFGESHLQGSGIDDPVWNAERLLMVALKRDRGGIYTELNRELSESELLQFKELLKKRTQHFPLAYIEEAHEFFGREFYVNEHVLIPRPETEDIITASLQLPLPERPQIVDLGAGSGNLALTLTLEIPTAHVFAVEVSAAALPVLRRNCGEQAQIVRADMFQPPFLSASFDLVVSNPPYVETEFWESLPPETRWEPRMALATDSLERTYDALLAQASKILKQGGWFVFEIGYQQAPRIEALCGKHQFQIVEIRQDQQLIPRIFVLRKL